ncbi:MAG: NrpR regulatory domain-containing protein [Methanomicrobiales archaeon]|nr:NrpR regulatory domain-containing protein [Methanomicrobiales archaeon]MDD1655365.1 NrpR regulatory domain-containing protein [Methanomicrobiales archaeon]
MSLIPSERKYLEILRILKEHREPMGAKRLSEMMAERGFVLTDRAVQYYLRYLDDMGFTEKVGNTGRVLTPLGLSETESALVDERIGFIISRLERLAFRTTFDPSTSTGDVAYNLSVVAEDDLDRVCRTFDRVTEAGYGFFSTYRILDRDPRIPPGHAGIVTICSITMDGVLQRMGVPVRMAFGGTLIHSRGKVQGFAHLVGYRGTTIDPLQLFISAGLTTIRSVVDGETGMALANVREVPSGARPRVESMVSLMRECGFLFPVAMGSRVFNLAPSPYRLSLVSYSGLNMVGCGIEEGISIRTEIGAGNIPFSKVMDATGSS